MPDFSTRTRARGGGGGAAGAGATQAGPEAQGRMEPQWAVDFQPGQGNAEVVELLTRQRFTEEVATEINRVRGMPLDRLGEQPQPSNLAVIVPGQHLEASRPLGGPEPEARQGQDAQSTHRPNDRLEDPFDKNERLLSGARVQMVLNQRNYQLELQRFQENWNQHRERYERLAMASHVPAPLIAALHYRECDMSFRRYLAQGDPLGTVPVNLPIHAVFHDWDQAALWALEAKRGNGQSLDIDEQTRDPAALATYAEAYNGLGYHNGNKVSPYVWAGTDVYRGGKWTRDGAQGYDPATTDAQVGVMAMLHQLGAVDEVDLESTRERSPDQAWWRVVYNAVVLQEGSEGPEVRALEDRLRRAGFLRGEADQRFDAQTAEAVRDWQRAHGMRADGIFGAGSALAMEAPRLWGELVSGAVRLEGGEGGLHVQLVQQRLVELGLLGSAVDGDFGPGAVAAVKRYQKAQAIEQTGVVDAETARRLRPASRARRT